MQVVVITGSTRGIGYGLADAFLGLGCAVTISGRTLQGNVSYLLHLHQASQKLRASDR